MRYVHYLQEGDAPIANNPPDLSTLLWLCIKSNRFRLMLSSQTFAAASGDISDTFVMTYPRSLSTVETWGASHAHIVAVLRRP